MTVTPPSNEPDSMQTTLLVLIATLPENEQDECREVVDKMADADIASGYELMKGQ